MTYKDIINNICSNIHTGLIDFDEPRSEASMPTQASSVFITNKQQGDWAEDVAYSVITHDKDNNKSRLDRMGLQFDDLIVGILYWRA